MVLSLFDSINPIVKALVIHLHWRYKIISFENTNFDLLKGFPVEVGLPH
jgi:hypothetical protein